MPSNKENTQIILYSDVQVFSGVSTRSLSVVVFSANVLCFLLSNSRYIKKQRKFEFNSSVKRMWTFLEKKAWFSSFSYVLVRCTKKVGKKER